MYACRQFSIVQYYDTYDTYFIFLPIGYYFQTYTAVSESIQDIQQRN